MTNKALPHTFQTRVVAATSVKKDVLVDRCCRPNSSIRAAKLVVCRKTRLPQAERPAVMNYTNGLSHQSTPGNLSTNAFLDYIQSINTSLYLRVFFCLNFGGATSLSTATTRACSEV